MLDSLILLLTLQKAGGLRLLRPLFLLLMFGVCSSTFAYMDAPGQNPIVKYYLEPLNGDVQDALYEGIWNTPEFMNLIFAVYGATLVSITFLFGNSLRQEKRVRLTPLR